MEIKWKKYRPYFGSFIGRIGSPVYKFDVDYLFNSDSEYRFSLADESFFDPTFAN